MTRTEYNEYRYIASQLRKMPATYGHCYTIPTDGSPDYKHRLDALYAANGLHPASVRIDQSMFDAKERIVYIYGRNDVHHDYYGRAYDWTGLYTPEERARFAEALD